MRRRVYSQPSAPQTSISAAFVAQPQPCHANSAIPANMDEANPTITGIQMRAAATRSSRSATSTRKSAIIPAAISPATKGEAIQPTAINAMEGQFTAPRPKVASPAPAMAPTTECVVLTGASSQVARLIQLPAASRAASIIRAVASPSPSVLPTSPSVNVAVTARPAMTAPSTSITATSNRPLVMPMAPAPTAGPKAFATSLPPIDSAR